MSGGSISKDQKYLLVKLVSTDQELLRAKFSATTKGSQRRWSAIAEQLNDIPGQSMEWKQWRLIWQDLHSAARKAAIAKHSKGTSCESPTCCLNQVTIPTDLISTSTIAPTTSTNTANVPTIMTIGSAIPTIKSTIPKIVPTDQTIEPTVPATEAAILTTILSGLSIESTIPTDEATIPTVETGLPTVEAMISTVETVLPTDEATVPAIILTESTPPKPKHRASRWRPVPPSENVSASDLLAAKAKAEMKQQYYNMKLEYKRQQLDRLHRMTIAIEMLAATLTPVPN